MNINWDAEKYTNDFSFVHEYGESLFQLVEWKEQMKVLDLGCGNGALSCKMAKMGMDVVGIDASPELLDIAKKTSEEVRFIEGDATNFEFTEKRDLVLSNAVFHWIEKQKQPLMLQCVYDALENGGQFVFEFGGFGNNELIHEQLRKEFNKHGMSYNMPFYFPKIGEYTNLMEKIGFVVEYATLFNRMTELKGDDGLADWIRMFVKTPFLRITEKMKDCIINEVVDNLKEELYLNNKWQSDYVRLRIKAKKI